MRPSPRDPRPLHPPRAARRSPWPDQDWPPIALAAERRNACLPLARLVAEVTRPVLGAGGAALGRLSLQWAEVVGDEIARLTTPERVTPGGAGGGTLTVRVAPAAGPEIAMAEPAILAAVNRFIGHPPVTRLRLVQGLPAMVERRATAAPAPAPRRRAAAPAAVDGIDDPELAAALLRLAAAVADRG